jgi:segregation and condensation protein B
MNHEIENQPDENLPEEKAAEETTEPVVATESAPEATLEVAAEETEETAEEETSAMESLEAHAQDADSDSEPADDNQTDSALSADTAEGDAPADAPTAPHTILPRPSDLTALDLVPILEAILFAADRPVSIDRMRQVIAPKPDEDAGPDTEFFTEALQTIRTRCETQDFGFELREAHGGFHFVTKMPFAEYVRRYQASKPFRLGRAALETLAIIAYRQPITRAEIDQVRGMDSSHLMRTLIERGLVRMAGKAEVPGRPVLYGTTPRFLEVMGLNGINDLPPLSELKQLEGDVDDPTRRMEQGMDRFMQPDPDARPLKELVEGENPVFDPGLSEIDSLIQSAGKPQEEVFESKLHQEIAIANQEALEAFQASMPRRRKRTTVTYDELVGGEASDAAPAEAVEAASETPTEASLVEASPDASAAALDSDDTTPSGNA